MKETSSAHHLQSTIPKVKCAGSSLMMWVYFSAAGTEGLIRVKESLMHQNIEIALMKTQSRHSEPQTGRSFTFQHINGPKYTARVAYTQLCERPWVAQPQPGIKPSQIFLLKPENVLLPPSNMRPWEVKRWGDKWQTKHLST